MVIHDDWLSNEHSAARARHVNDVTGRFSIPETFLRSGTGLVKVLGFSGTSKYKNPP